MRVGEPSQPDARARDPCRDRHGRRQRRGVRDPDPGREHVDSEEDTGKRGQLRHESRECRHAAYRQAESEDPRRLEAVQAAVVQSVPDPEQADNALAGIVDPAAGWSSVLQAPVAVASQPTPEANES